MRSPSIIARANGLTPPTNDGEEEDNAGARAATDGEVDVDVDAEINPG